MDEAKATIQKEAGDLRSSLREVEKSRLEARRELQELRRQVGSVKMSRSLKNYPFSYSPSLYFMKKIIQICIVHVRN